MGRLRPETLVRCRTLACRVLDVVQVLEKGRLVPRRVIEQLAAAGTSVGANAYEADEALSRADFVKTLGISVKELNETRFWLELCAEREWVAAARLALLLNEVREIKKMFGTMITRTKARGTPARATLK